MELSFIAGILNSGDKGFIIVLIILFGYAFNWACKEVKEYKKNKEKEKEASQEKYEILINHSDKLTHAIENLSDKIAKNDGITFANCEHILEIAEVIDEKHGTDKTKKFTKKYMNLQNKQGERKNEII